MSDLSTSMQTCLCFTLAMINTSLIPSSRQQSDAVFPCVIVVWFYEMTDQPTVICSHQWIYRNSCIYTQSALSLL